MYDNSGRRREKHGERIKEGRRKRKGIIIIIMRNFELFYDSTSATHTETERDKSKFKK